MSISSARFMKVTHSCRKHGPDSWSLAVPSNPNEDEFLKSAPPGQPSEFPNETVAQRKARTLGPTKPVKGGGAQTSPPAQRLSEIVATARPESRSARDLVVLVIACF